MTLVYFTDKNSLFINNDINNIKIIDYGNLYYDQSYKWKKVHR
jgi:hypothetical protein